MKRPNLRRILLLLALLTSPLTCCGLVYFLNLLPASLLPSGVDFMVNLFETEARLENRTGETLYITPFTTTYGDPVIIQQPASLRRRDIPLPPGDSIALTYDAADMPLSGIAVCRSNGDCRLVKADYSNVYSLDSFEDLPKIEQDWLAAIRSQPQYNFGMVLFPVLGLLPLILFLSWWYLGRRDDKQAG